MAELSCLHAGLLNLMKMSNVFSLRQRPQSYTDIVNRRGAITTGHYIKQSKAQIRELTNVAQSVKCGPLSPKLDMAVNHYRFGLKIR